MKWQIRVTADAFDEPTDDPDAPAEITFNADDHMIFDQFGQTPEGNWTQVGFRTSKLWVRTADIVEQDPTKFIPVNLFDFVYYSTVTAEDFNAQQQGADVVGVSRDYILALSVVLNELERFGFADTVLKDFDPFRFTDDEWAAFCQSPAAPPNKLLRSFDRLDPLAQVDMAVSHVFDAIKAVRSAMPIPDPVAGAYVPNSVDLFLTHLLGTSAGPAIVKDTTAGLDLSKPWADYVTAAGGNPASLKTRYPRFLNVPGKESAAGLVALIGSTFDDAYVVVSKIVSDALPQEAPETSGPPETWMEVAHKELDKHIGRPDSRILDYFKATDTTGASVVTPWCAAFVSFCLESAGAKIPQHESAAAGIWTRWGRPVAAPQGPIPVGAIVVVSPTPETHVAGHVAFCAGEDPKDNSRIQLLGGNQGSAHTVKVSSFPRSCVLAIRWPTDPAAPSGGSAAGGGPGAGGAAGVEVSVGEVADVAIGVFTSNDWNRYCNVLGKRESGNRYSVVNSLGYSGRWQFGALALADGGYVRRGCSLGQLLNTKSWTGKDGIHSRADWCSSPQVQNKAMLEYTRSNYVQLKQLRVVDSTTPKDVLAGYLAAAHLVGVGGAEDLHNGRFRHDANGVTSQQYFDLLSNAFKT